MQGVARNFFTLAIIYALCGMALGIHMAMSQDHSQMPVHAHTMVAGWLMSSVFAFFYHLFPAARDSMLAKIHFWLTAVSGIGLLVGLYFLLAGNPVDRAVCRHFVDGFLCLDAAFRVHRLTGDLSARRPPEQPRHPVPLRHRRLKKYRRR